MDASKNANVKFNKKSGNAGLYGWQVKKNKATGDTANLRGYTVGSRAPPMAVKSGTTIAEDGGFYKGFGSSLSRKKWKLPGQAGDGGIDLRSYNPAGASDSGDLFYHSGDMLSKKA